MVSKSKEYGLSGVCITDHEIVGSYVKAKKLEQEFDFPVLLGNEIYLVSDEQDAILREGYNSETMYYPHFLLIALDMEGNRQLRELSTIAWENAYKTSIVRTTTLMSDVERIIGSNKGHVVASSACLGSFLNRNILGRQLFGQTERDANIEWFLQWAVDTFGKENFYLECQPAYPDNEEQWAVNNYILELSAKHNIPYIITTDAHYLSKDLLKIHSCFLNSDDNQREREVESFYATAYLMDEDEVRGYFEPFWTKDQIDTAINNTIKIGKRAERFVFDKKQIIPKIEFEDDWENNITSNLFPNTEYIQKTLNSPYEDDRYLMYLLTIGIKKLIPECDYNETFDRLEEELKQFWLVSEQIEDRLHSYFVTVAKLVDIMWNEGDSIVAPGRGSAVSSIICYLLEITQINPLKMPVEMPFYRFIDEMRPEIADIDIDTQSDRRTRVFNAIKDYFESIGGDVINCCTYSTLTSKAAILTACRGLGIDSDIAQSISGLIPVERGFNWDISDTYYGNEKDDRKAVKEFVKIIDKHEGLLETALLLEGIIINRGTHAGGVFLINGAISESNAVMRNPSMIRTSQFDLHDSEEFGLIKYDLLTTKGTTKIRKTLDLLIEDGIIVSKDTLKETYMTYLNPMTLDYDKPEIWDLVAKNEVVDLFQFDTIQGIKTLKQIKPHSMLQTAQANSLVRLQKQDDATESPVETYVKFKENISLAYNEMDDWKVPKDDQKAIERILKQYNFVADTQESMMALVRSPHISSFNVAESHKIRKAVAKKSDELFEEMRQFFYKKGTENGTCEETLDYIWEVQIKRQKSYSFSILHCIAYTYIALQELVLYHNYPTIYWNTACLSVNASADEEDDSNKSTSYGKVAKAIGQIQERGTKVALPDINTAQFEFKPDKENNEIVFGLKGISGLGDDIVHEIIDKRPYSSINDFFYKTNISKAGLIALTKAGSFDKMYPNKSRKEIMELTLTTLAEKDCEIKEELTFRNWKSIIDVNIIPNSMKDCISFYNFNKYVTDKKFFHSKIKRKNFHYIDDYASKFFAEYYKPLMKEDIDYFYDIEKGTVVFAISVFNKIYNKQMESVKKWLSQDSTIKLYNNSVHKSYVSEQWEKNCKGSYAKWSMDSLSYYPEDHELKSIDREKYSIVSYFDLPRKPTVIDHFVRGGRKWDKYELSRICGTVLDKDRNKGMVTLLTPEGVVDVKFYKGSFMHYDGRISMMSDNGKKTILEKSWFTRGTCLMISGIRQGDQFIAKKYFDSIYQHTVCLIEDILSNGECILKLERERGD